MVQFPAPEVAIAPPWSLAESVIVLQQSQALALRARRKIPRREGAFSYFNVNFFAVGFLTYGVYGRNL